MKRILIAVFTLFASGPFAHAAGDCKDGPIKADPPPEVTVALCDAGTIKRGDIVTINAGGEVRYKVSSNLDIGAGISLLTLETSDSGSFHPFEFTSVDVTAGGKVHKGIKVQSHFQNYQRYSWSVGPATKGSAGESGGTTAAVTSTATTDTASTTANAIGLKYSGEYARGGFLGGMQPPAGAKIGTQTVASLSIDTTDQKDAAFVDDNRGTLGFHFTQLDLGELYKHGNAGLDVRASKAFHHDVRDVDIAATASGWIPLIPSLTLLSDAEFIAAPLSLNASLAYRNRNEGAGSMHGQVFEGSALYHLFLANSYQVDLSSTWTVNSKGLRDANTPRTQKLFKAQVSYLVDPNKGFQVLTSIEDGSAGVMLTKVRQYFLGVAFSKLNLAGASK